MSSGLSCSRDAFAAVLLAAGRGKRMKSDLPKVLHPLVGRPMLEYVLDAAHASGAAPRVVVAGAAMPAVAEIAERSGAEVVVQPVPRGTGDAVRWARPLLNGFEGDIVILCGDAPIISSDQIIRLVARHRSEGNALTILTAEVPDASGFGRIIRGPDGRVSRIVEDADASPDEKLINEVNTGAYCVQAGVLFPELDRLRPDNRQGELYLTDVVGALFREGMRVGALSMGVPPAPLGINTLEELQATERVLAARAVN